MHTTSSCVFSPITSGLVSTRRGRVVYSIFVFELPNLDLELLLVENHLLHHLVTLFFTLKPHNLLNF
jgi:hypothetical protein